MWAYNCGNSVVHNHTYELAVESLLLHRGAMNLMLEANGIRPVTPCAVKHDLVYTTKPCDIRGCRLETDVLSKPTQEQVLQIMALNCRLVRKD